MQYFLLLSANWRKTFFQIIFCFNLHHQILLMHRFPSISPVSFIPTSHHFESLLNDIECQHSANECRILWLGQHRIVYVYL